MCRNGQYTERGIKQIDGFMSERWRIEPEYAMKVDRSLGLLGVLLEPTTVVTKAWEQVQAVGQRAFWEPRTVLVTGAGPIGLLAALVWPAARPGRARVWTASSQAPSPSSFGPWGRRTTPGALRMSASTPTSSSSAPASAKSSPTASTWHRAAESSASRASAAEAARRASPQMSPQTIVLQNNVIVGSVNANRRHWYKAVQVLARADRAWLGRLITRCEGPEGFMRALQRQPEDIKVVIQFAEA